MTDFTFESGYSYSAYYIPTNETWYILGVNPDIDIFCASGWPPSIGKLSNCKDFQKKDLLTEEELKYRNETFGTNWL